ncbi:MAG TPA: hypothetical protein VFP72_08490 [Kineosporiaceae bacterium]|nr:hypothetical protein [Kineosporiaceae bacterium]
MRPLVRHRVPWFQGHLRSWRLIPAVLRGVSGRARGDVQYHPSTPVLLITSLLTVSLLVSLADGVVAIAHGRNPFSWWALITYLLAFGPAVTFSRLYQRQEGLGLLRTWGLAHLYVLYGLVWYLAGRRAVGRTLTGRTGSTKAARIPEQDR